MPVGLWDVEVVEVAPVLVELPYLKSYLVSDVEKDRRRRKCK